MSRIKKALPSAPDQSSLPSNPRDTTKSIEEGKKKQRIGNYSFEESQSIINYMDTFKPEIIFRQATKRDIFWKELEATGLMKGRSYRSLKGHYYSNLRKNYKKYSMSASLKGVFKQWSINKLRKGSKQNSIHELTETIKKEISSTTDTSIDTDITSDIDGKKSPEQSSMSHAQKQEKKECGGMKQPSIEKSSYGKDYKFNNQDFHDDSFADIAGISSSSCNSTIGNTIKKNVKKVHNNNHDTFNTSSEKLNILHELDGAESSLRNNSSEQSSISTTTEKYEVEKEEKNQTLPENSTDSDDYEYDTDNDEHFHDDDNIDDNCSSSDSRSSSSHSQCSSSCSTSNISCDSRRSTRSRSSYSSSSQSYFSSRSSRSSNSQSRASSRSSSSSSCRSSVSTRSTCSTSSSSRGSPSSHKTI